MQKCVLYCRFLENYSFESLKLHAFTSGFKSHLRSITIKHKYWTQHNSRMKSRWGVRGGVEDLVVCSLRWEQTEMGLLYSLKSLLNPINRHCSIAKFLWHFWVDLPYPGHYKGINVICISNGVYMFWRDLSGLMVCDCERPGCMLAWLIWGSGDSVVSACLLLSLMRDPLLLKIIWFI